MATINTYLTFNGNCEEAFLFYKSVFGGEFSHIGKFKDMPQEPGFPVQEEVNANKIMHISLPIGNTVLMGSDTAGEWDSDFIKGNNFSISINAESKKEADEIFKKLAENGSVIMPMANTF